MLKFMCHSLFGIVWFALAYSIFVNIQQCRSSQLIPSTINTIHKIATSNMQQCCRDRCEILLHGTRINCEKRRCKCIPLFNSSSQFNPREVTHLNLDYNHITNLPNESFAHYSNLRYLSITHNIINRIDQEAFIRIENLQCLNISMNPISMLPNGVFASLKKLEILDYQNISTTCNGFNGFSLDRMHIGFKELTLKGNRQFRFPTFFNKNRNISLVPGLEVLDLGYNFLENLKSEYFLGVLNLKILYLNNNRVKYIEKKCFWKMKRLKMLSLVRNNLKTVEASAFASASLEYLDLADAEQYAVNQISFRQLPNLVHLNLRNAEMRHLKIIYGGLFANSRRLKLLNLHRTRLSNNQVRVFLQNLTNLEVLSLAGNVLDTVEQETFEPFAKTLRKLYLGSNLISTINFTSLPTNMWSQLESLELQDNPWRCGCRLAWFKRWFHHNQDRIVHASFPASYMCSSNGIEPRIPLMNFTKVDQEMCATTPIDVCFSATLVFIVVFDLTSLFAASLYRFRWRIRY